MRAREPDHTGVVDRDGVHVAYEVHGSGEQTILLLPAWAISDSRLWKAQIPYLARHFQVITYDPRGNGRSDRPTDPDKYQPMAQVGDAVAILDEVGVDRALLVGNSAGTILGFLMAAAYPDRVAGLIAIGTTLNLDGLPDEALGGAFPRFEERLDTTDGWAKYNRHYWEEDYEGFVDFFVHQAFSEPHSSKMQEDGTEWAFNTNPEVLTATIASRVGVPLEQQASRLRSLAPQVTCPVLVVHGEDDHVAPVRRGRQFSELLGARFELIPEAGHCPQVRHPAFMNRLIRNFAWELADRPAPRRPARRGANPKVLYLSSPIGLGHARRDLAIAQELRALVPEAEVTWLAQDPVTRLLDRRGETVHPASKHLASESSHLESEAGEHDLHIFEAFRDMDEIMVANFGVFSDVVEEERFDLVVGDEAWDVDHFLHEYPPAKQTKFAWLTDFVGFVPMPSGGERERAIAADYNLEMIRHIERHPDIRDLSIFVGDADDVITRPFGKSLPPIRDWVEKHYQFSGFITGFDHTALPDRDEMRAALGYSPDETVCVVTVGGSGVGSALIRRVIEAHPLAAETVPNLRTVVVTGPRIDPEGLPPVEGVELSTFLPDLYRHLAVADISVVQGGLATTMELTALRRPFIYLPLENHFEQQVHVRHRLERHKAGRLLHYPDATPETIAGAIIEGTTAPTDYVSVPRDAARKAANMVASLL